MILLLVLSYYRKLRIQCSGSGQGGIKTPPFTIAPLHRDVDGVDRNLAVSTPNEIYLAMAYGTPVALARFVRYILLEFEIRNQTIPFVLIAS